MSFIGKPVYKIWATNALRFGNVTADKTKDNWKYVRVDWKNDEAYKVDIERVVKLRNIEYDEEHEWHRIDNIKFFDPLKMAATLGKLRS